MGAKFRFKEVWDRRSDPENFKKFGEMFVSFTQDLQELFMVPKLSDKGCTLKKKNELVVVFICFLIRLLQDPQTYRIVSDMKDQVATLLKELKFLITVLGDAPFQDTEYEEIKNLLAEFEGVANEAGSLVLSFIFATDQVFKTMDKALGVFLQHIELLKANIIKYSNCLPYITPKASAVDSLFIVDSLLYDLEDLMNRDDDPIVDVKGQIKLLHHGLMLSQAIFKDIKASQQSEIEELKETVTQMREVAYEAEYLIDSLLVGDAPLWYLKVRIPAVIHKIEFLGTGLQQIKKNYDIGTLKVAKDFSAQLSLQPKGNSEVGDITVGFEDKATDILDQLIGGTEHLQIISIFGMPGLGKTTLAKKLYNHPSVNYHFHRRSWCVVSQTYQRKSLLINLLISMGSELDKDSILREEEESLAEHIYRGLKGRRYLIAMDDIWNSNVWDDLRRYFPDDGTGSRILFTSRNKDVGPPNSIIYALPSLSNDQCWELLEKKVFHNAPCPPQLLGIGKQIAADCRGLPLAVVVIAGILSTMEKEESAWKNAGGSLASYIFSDENNSMMQILKLSYRHLPDHLKPCFLYFGAFPEDAEIPVKKLKWLWIAEGFIRKEEEKSAERMAEEYLMELIDKSLVIVAKRRSDGGVKACVVHDLLRDLCLRIAEEENFLKLVVDNCCLIYTKHHRLYFHKNLISEASTQLSLSYGLRVRCFFTSLFSSSLYVFNMKLLRVLDMLDFPRGGGNLDAIAFLVNLRYLAARQMPASIGRLVNLEFLVVKVIYIPLVVLKMMKLRYVRATDLARFEQYCDSSQKNNLEYLSGVSIHNLKDEEMLRCSPHLRKLKCKCESFVDEQGEYRHPDLRFLTQLESLKMTALYLSGVTEINFPPNIKKLTLSGLSLPWEKMSMIGVLPNLEVLKLVRRAFVGERWDTREGEFQQLRFLKLESLDLAQWNVDSDGHFPKLQRLVLHECYHLQEIPCEIGEIATLQLIEVQSCPKVVAESAIKIEQEQREFGNEEFKVIITSKYTYRFA